MEFLSDLCPVQNPKFVDDFVEWFTFEAKGSTWRQDSQRNTSKFAPHWLGVHGLVVGLL